MPFRDFDEVAEPLVLPIRGKEYTIAPIGIADGAHLTEALDPDSDLPLSDAEFFRLVLGDVYEQLKADNAPAVAVTRAAATSLAEFQRGRAAALVMWETGGHPKALEGLVEAVMSRTTQQPTPPAEASTTQPRKRGSGTKTSQSS